MLTVPDSVLLKRSVRRALANGKVTGKYLHSCGNRADSSIGSDDISDDGSISRGG